MDILITVTKGDDSEFYMIPGTQLHMWLDTKCQVIKQPKRKFSLDI